MAEEQGTLFLLFSQGGRVWTRERVIEEIQRSQVGGFVSAKNMTLSTTARRMFGSWGAACKAAGFKPASEKPRFGICFADGCDVRVRSPLARYCEIHYYRLRRTGTTKRQPVIGKYRTGHGYIKLLKREHPLADRKGHVAEHRFVMYEIHGEGSQKCFWCNRELSWKDVVIDHLNEVKDDNCPENLVISCNDCNRARGALVPFVRRMRPEAFATFVATAGRLVVGQT